ncbi:MAG: hypothetical protein H6727_18075 [Myxococcales bacterium]|nr:hypothetical protein [Myxococcales bacterium]
MYDNTKSMIHFCFSYGASFRVFSLLLLAAFAFVEVGCWSWAQDKEDDARTLLRISKSASAKQGFENVADPEILRGGPIVRAELPVQAGYCYRAGVAWSSSFPVYASIHFLKNSLGQRTNDYRYRIRRSLLYGTDAVLFCVDKTGYVRLSLATMNRSQSALLNIRTMYAFSVTRRKELSTERLLRRHRAWVRQQKAKERRESKK